MDGGRRFFEEVTDYRGESGRCLHELSDISWLVLYGLLADCETFEDIYDYACNKEATLRQFLSLPAGIPSHDTLNRVFRHLDPGQLKACLTRWGAAIVAQLAGRQLIVASSAWMRWARAAHLLEREADYVLALKQSQGELFTRYRPILLPY